MSYEDAFIVVRSDRLWSVDHITTVSSAMITLDSAQIKRTIGRNSLLLCASYADVFISCPII